jgi:hypothetical protein
MTEAARTSETLVDNSLTAYDSFNSERIVIFLEEDKFKRYTVWGKSDFVA